MDIISCLQAAHNDTLQEMNKRTSIFGKNEQYCNHCYGIIEKVKLTSHYTIKIR